MSTFNIDAYDETDCRKSPPDVKALSLLHACYRVHILPGDFVSVPMFWAHSVNTTCASLGLSGYSLDSGTSFADD